jgi:hypothetical protein
MTVSGNDDSRWPSGERDPDPAEQTTYGRLSLADAYALVGNEVRARILLALSRERAGRGEPPVLPFSELRDRVEADVPSSQFNYHLQQLVGTFVENRGDGNAQLLSGFVDEEPDGYALRPEGTTFTRFLRAGLARDGAEVESRETPLDCHYCGTTVRLTYRNSILHLQCPECEYLYDYDLIPPGVVDGVEEGRNTTVHEDSPSVYDRAAEYVRERRLAFARGSCPLCGNAVDTSFLDADETTYPRRDRRELFVNRSCDHCGDRNYMRLGEVLQRDASLIAFCYDHDLDVTATPPWEIPFVVTDEGVTVHGTDPWEASLRVERDGDVLELTVDENLDVIERSRE